MTRIPDWRRRRQLFGLAHDPISRIHSTYHDGGARLLSANVVPDKSKVDGVFARPAGKNRPGRVSYFISSWQLSQHVLIGSQICADLPSPRPRPGPWYSRLKEEKGAVEGQNVTLPDPTTFFPFISFSFFLLSLCRRGRLRGKGLVPERRGSLGIASGQPEEGVVARIASIRRSHRLGPASGRQSFPDVICSSRQMPLVRWQRRRRGGDETRSCVFHVKATVGRRPRRCAHRHHGERGGGQGVAEPQSRGKRALEEESTMSNLPVFGDGRSDGVHRLAATVALKP